MNARDHFIELVERVRDLIDCRRRRPQASGADVGARAVAREVLEHLGPVARELEAAQVGMMQRPQRYRHAVESFLRIGVLLEARLRAMVETEGSFKESTAAPERMHDPLARVERLTRKWEKGARCTAVMDIFYGATRAEVAQETCGTVEDVTRAFVLLVRWDGLEGLHATSPDCVDPEVTA